MPRINRSRLIPAEAASVQHVTTRCTRQLHMLAAAEGEPEGLRKEILLARLEELVDQMAVEVLAFAFMDNHVHLVLRTRPRVAAAWPVEEVLRRWLTLHPLRNGYNLPREAEEAELAELVGDDAAVAETRAKLASVSQLMKEFKQHGTERINALEGTTGSLWQGRFKSRNLEDPTQLVAAMVYVDLNPFAAGLCETPEAGRYTSLAGRLDHDESVSADSADGGAEGAEEADGPRLPARRSSAAWLVPLDESAEAQRRCGQRPLANGAMVAEAQRGCVVPGLSLRVYLKLVDAVARRLRDEKRRLHPATAGVFERIGIDAESVAASVLATAQRDGLLPR